MTDRITCEHINFGDKRCNASPLRDNRFCKDHYKYYPADECEIRKPRFVVPLFNSYEAIQLGMQQALQAQVDGILDQKQANAIVHAGYVATMQIKQIATNDPEVEARKAEIKQREAQHRAELRTQQKVEEFKAIERARRELIREGIADERAFQKSEEERESREAKERGDIPPEKQSFFMRLMTETYLQGMRRKSGEEAPGELERTLEIKRLEHQLAYNKMMDRKETEEKQAEGKATEATGEAEAETKSKPPEPALPEAIRRLGSLA